MDRLDYVFLGFIAALTIVGMLFTAGYTFYLIASITDGLATYVFSVVFIIALLIVIVRRLPFKGR